MFSRIGEPLGEALEERSHDWGVPVECAVGGKLTGIPLGEEATGVLGERIGDGDADFGEDGIGVTETVGFCAGEGPITTEELEALTVGSGTFGTGAETEPVEVGTDFTTGTAFVVEDDVVIPAVNVTESPSCEKSTESLDCDNKKDCK